MPAPVGPKLAAALQDQLAAISRQVVAAVIAEVPAYRTALNRRMQRKIEGAVHVALHGFVELAAQDTATGTPPAPVVEASYDLGRGEARAGRSMEALLSAYRVGARLSWREFSTIAVENRLPANRTAQLAEFVFAYIDELSAAGAAGHAAELDALGRARDRLLEQLARELLDGAGPDQLQTAAERADWSPPEALLAVLAPAAELRRLLTLFGPDALPATDAPGLDPDDRLVAVLVPAASRAAVLAQVRERPVVVGPARPWPQVASSYARALRTYRTDGPSPTAVDTEERLAGLVLTADPEALDDLRARALSPLDTLRPAARDKLVKTLRAFLLNHGRREAMAAQLFVHPQTIRYRMGQLRELFGTDLEDPRRVLDLTLAVGLADGGVNSPR